MPSKWNLMLPSVMDVALTLNTWYSIVLTYGQPVDVMWMQRDACNGVKLACTPLQVSPRGRPQLQVPGLLVARGRV